MPLSLWVLTFSVFLYLAFALSLKCLNSFIRILLDLINSMNHWIPWTIIDLYGFVQFNVYLRALGILTGLKMTYKCKVLLRLRCNIDVRCCYWLLHLISPRGVLPPFAGPLLDCHLFCFSFSLELFQNSSIRSFPSLLSKKYSKNTSST